MISILIYTDNWDITTLVNKLVVQGNSVNVEYEIIVIDDFSNSAHDEYNFSMNHYDYVNVYRNEKKIGRGKTRNILAEKAKYEWLLFISEDAYIGDSFIINYIKEIRENKANVICGGSTYSDMPPSKKEYMLHWNYATKRNQKTLEQRKSLGLKAFASDNFAINNLVFVLNQFKENIRDYIYDDVIYAKKMKKSMAKISYIDNSIRHLKLDTNEVFFYKYISSKENIEKAYEQGVLDREDIYMIPKYRWNFPVKSLHNYFKKIFIKRAIKTGNLLALEFSSYMSTN